MQLMPPTDAVFLLPESREQPMHVGGLQLFDLPTGADRSWLRELHRRAVTVQDLAPAFRKRPYRSALTLGQWMWLDDSEVDLEHHVRHSALPEPGRIRELLALVSRLHGTPLDRQRPLWETHLIEGLEGNRFAVYTKVHHSLMDGVSANALLQSSLSTDPDERNVPMPYQQRPVQRRERQGGHRPGLFALPGLALGAVRDTVGLGPRMLQLAQGALRQQAAVLPGQAPRSPFNVSITGSRRFAADAWSMDRIRAVAKAADATVNDVVLGMCAAALRDYLLDLDALPAAPLVAMTPVSLRKDGGPSGGNAVGTILCSLATDVADPQARLLAVRDSMNAGKAALAGLSQLQVSALSAAVMAPLLFNSLVGLHKVVRPPFNLVISNVPGPQQTLFWNGARLQGAYPLSIPVDGQALNITVTSYDGWMQFGLVGCRRSVPHLQRLLSGLDAALTGLEEAFVTSS